MNKSWRRALCVGLLIAFAGGSAAPAAAAELLVEEVRIKARVGSWNYDLEGIIVKPADAARPLPVVLMTHGSPRDAADRPNRRPRLMLTQARNLARRGWLVVVFSRRGFGGSEGPFAEGYECARPDFARALSTAAQDIAGVYAEVAKRPDADATRILGMGVSVGGAAMLAWAATQPAGLAGIVNVSGGTGSYAPGRNCDEERLVSAFAAFGEKVRVPTLWLYAENDRYFDPELVARMHLAFNRKGASAELAKFGPLGSDGHDLFGLFAGQVLWLPRLDAFLRAQGLPTWDAAPLDALNARLDPSTQRVLAHYIAGPTEKALSLSRTKALARWFGGTATLEEARRRSLETCALEAGEPCDVVAENFRPVQSQP